MFLVIDNYDSFVHNLARYFEVAGAATHIVRNDALSLDEIGTLKPEAIIISPGPGTPDQAGISVETVRRFGINTPIFGVCLGHQCIAEAYGGQTIRSNKPMHGRASQITHNGQDLFSGLPNPLSAGRYHSLISALPETLQSTAHDEDGIVMALRHETHPVYGVQFHPESILTPDGAKLIENFVKIAAAYNSRRKAA